MASARLSVRIPPHLQKSLDSLAEATGKSEAEVVREALQEYCLKHAAFPTAYDEAKAAGVIGCVRGGPTDRSTNPRHMSGFGRD
jgi:metal-responsive CopG/Arc/MetJ family transcriptional regulator